MDYFGIMDLMVYSDTGSSRLELPKNEEKRVIDEGKKTKEPISQS